MQDEIQTNETKKSSKDMWLFLIFLDIIALCVFGFFIYNSFSSAFKEEVQNEPFLEEVAVEDIVVEEPMSAPKIADKQEPKTEEAKVEEPAKAEPKPEVKEQPKPKVEAPKPAAKKRQSVFVENIGKPTRSVTFKYYDKASSVSVVGGFTMKKPVKMKKSGGVWSVNMRIFPGDYRYMLIVNGKEVVDPNAEVDDGKSILVVK